MKLSSPVLAVARHRGGRVGRRHGPSLSDPVVDVCLVVGSWCNKLGCKRSEGVMMQRWIARFWICSYPHGTCVTICHRALLPSMRRASATTPDTRHDTDRRSCTGRGGGGPAGAVAVPVLAPAPLPGTTSGSSPESYASRYSPDELPSSLSTISEPLLSKPSSAA